MAASSSTPAPLCSSPPPPSSSLQPQPVSDPLLSLVATAKENEALVKEMISAALDRDKARIESSAGEMEKVGKGLEAVAAAVKGEAIGGDCLLHLAALLGDEFTCKYLTKYSGTDVNADLFGATPLHFALYGACPDSIIEILMDACADVNIAAHGDTPLILASSKGLSGCIKHLLRNGANPNFQNGNGKVAIEVAAAGEHLDCMQILFPKTMPLEAYTNWDIIEILRQNGRQDDALQDQVAPSSGPSIINQNASLVQLSLESNKSQAVPCIPGRRTINSSKNDLQEASSDPPAIVFAADSRTASEAVIEVNTSGNTLQNDAKNGAPTDPASDALKEEKKRKGIASFMHANMDKLPAALLTLSVLGLAAAHGSGKNEGNNIVKLNENLYEILCFGSIVGLHSGILLYGYSAYYKETETTDDLGFKILSYVALGASAYLLLVFCIILVSLERGNQAVIVSAAVTVALIYALVWPFRDKHKTLLGLMKERWDKRKARIRDQRPELPRTSTGVMGRLWSGSRS